MKLEGKTLARNVLEAMISHSDYTATDAILRAVGVDNVRDLISEVGLPSVKIPESTRQLFGYLATGKDASPTWAELQSYVEKPPNPQPAINDVESMLASASDMVKWYQTALLDPTFSPPPLSSSSSASRRWPTPFTGSCPTTSRRTARAAASPGTVSARLPCRGRWSCRPWTRTSRGFP